MRAMAAHRSGKRAMAGWLSILWITATMTAATAARADIYYWEDDQGVIHFSNQDAPPSAALYMREVAPQVRPQTDETPHEIDRASLAAEVARQQAETQQRLEAANRKLNHALERVDELTESVSRSRARAAAAEEAARQAAIEADAAGRDRSDIKERVIVHSAPYGYYDPYRHRHKQYGPKHREHRFKHRYPRHRDHEKKYRPNFNRSPSKLEKIKRQRHNAFNYHIPKPILPPGKKRIPRAYGIR